MSTLNAGLAAKSKPCSQSHITPIQEKTFPLGQFIKGIYAKCFLGHLEQ